MANEVRLIDAYKLEEMVRSSQKYNPHRGYSYGMHSAEHEHFIRIIDKAPTIDPESLRPKGRWTENKRTMYSAAIEDDVLWFTYTCSECSWEAMNNSRYCPNCGADMREG